MSASTPAAPTPSFTAIAVPQATVASLTSASSSLFVAPGSAVSGAMTLEAWINPTDVGTAGAAVLFWLTSGSQTLALSNPANLTIALGTASLATNVTLASGVWQHVSLAVSAPVNGTVAVRLVVNSATAFQAPAALAAPAQWPANGAQTVGLGQPSSQATALIGLYAEFRLWTQALDSALVVTDSYYLLTQGDGSAGSGPLVVWPLATLPADATSTNVQIVDSTFVFRDETLTVNWSAVEGADSYNLKVYAADNIWGVVYPDLTGFSQTVEGFLVDHDVCAAIQSVTGGVASAWSDLASGQIFRLAIPAVEATAPQGASPQYVLSWTAIDQAQSYAVTTTPQDGLPTTQTQPGTTLDLSENLGSPTGSAVAISAASGTVIGPAVTAAAPSAPAVTLTYQVDSAGQAGLLNLTWTSVPDAAFYYVAWTAVGTGTLPAPPTIVPATTTSMGPYTAAGTDGITYTAEVQALAASGFSAAASTSVAVLPVTAPTNLAAVTAPPSGSTNGQVALSWAYTGAGSSNADYAVVLLDTDTNTELPALATTTSHTFSDPSLVTTDIYTATVRYSTNGVVGPAATITVYLLPFPGNFSASWNATDNVISASYNAVSTTATADGRAVIAYTITVVGPLTGTACTALPENPSVNTTLPETTSTTPSWPSGDVPGLDASQKYSVTVLALVQGGACSSNSSSCLVLEPYEAPPVTPDLPTQDPIGVTTGALAYSATRLTQGAVVPIVFTISYNSQFPTHAQDSAIVDGALGMRWRHTFETALVIDSAQATVTVITGAMDMSEYYYLANPGELAPVGPFQGTRLFRMDSGYLLLLPDQTSWSFDAGGTATSFADPYGNTLSLNYQGAQLHSVALVDGSASMTFGYDGNGKLNTVAASGGESLTITVTGNQLAQLSVPGIGNWSYFYATAGSATTTALLQQVTDPWSNTEVYNDYDDQGRVTQQYTADGYAAAPQFYTTLRYGTASYNGNTVGTTTVTTPEGAASTYYYSPTSRIVLKKETPLGTLAGTAMTEIVEIAYDGFYQPVQSTLYLGPSSSYKDGQGNATAMEYNANRLIAKIVDPAGRTQVWSYDAANNLIAQQDIWGNVTQNTYVPNSNLLASTIDPMGQATTFEYWPQSGYGFNGLLKTVTDPLGNGTALTYLSGSGLPSVVTRPDKSTRTYGYDAAGRQTTVLAQTVDGAALSNTVYTFDALGRPKTFTSQMGDQPAEAAFSYAFNYDTPDNDTASITYPADGGGQFTRVLTLNPDRRVVGRTYSPFDGTTVTAATGYDKDGRVASRSLGDRPATTYVYNALNDLIAVTNPLGKTSTSVTQQIVGTGNGPYQTQRLLTAPALTYADPTTGIGTDYIYTQSTLTDPGGLVVQQTLTLAAAASPSTVVWERTSTWSYTTATVPASGSIPAYQALTVTVTATPSVPSGQAVSSSQTSNGSYLVTSMTDGGGNVTTVSYAPAADPTGSGMILLKSTTTPPAGAAVDQYFDPLGRFAGQASGSGTEARAGLYGYDGLDRLVRVRVGDTLANLASGTLSAPGAAQTAYSYQFDTSGGNNRVRVDVTQPTNDPDAVPVVALSTYYDAANRVVAETFADGGTYTRSYAPWGAVATWAIPSGGTIGFGFDTAGELTSVLPSGQPEITHVLDACGNRTQTSVGGTPAINRSFDAWNRLISRTATGTGTVTQTQWPNGRLRTLGYPDGKVVNYALDGLGRWNQITDWAARATNYAYTKTGALQSATFANGVVASYGYNAAGAPMSFSVSAPDGAILTQLTYAPNQHNEPGQASGIWPLPPTLPSVSTGLTYDGDTLTEYDTTALSSNADAALTQIPAGQGGDLLSVGYLPYGPLNSVGSITYQYDADGMLTGRADGATSWSYTVTPNDFTDPLLNMGSPARSVIDSAVAGSGFGEAVLLPVHGTGATPPNIDQALDLVLQIGSGGTIQTSFVHGLGPISQEAADGTVAYFQADPAGNLVAMTGTNGQPYALRVFGPYGDRRASSGAPSPFYGFAGRFGVSDDGSGLLAMRARFYAPQLMRLTARDLLAGNPYSPVWTNRYVYAANDPLAFADPLGLSFWDSVKDAVKYITSGGRKGSLSAGGVFGAIGLGLAGIGGLAILTYGAYRAIRTAMIAYQGYRLLVEVVEVEMEVFEDFGGDGGDGGDGGGGGGGGGGVEVTYTPSQSQAQSGDYSYTPFQADEPPNTPRVPQPGEPHLKEE